MPPMTPRAFWRIHSRTRSPCSCSSSNSSTAISFRSVLGAAQPRAGGRWNGIGPRTGRWFHAPCPLRAAAAEGPGSVDSWRERTVRGYRKAGDGRPQVRRDVLLDAVAALLHRTRVAEHDAPDLARREAAHIARAQQRLLEDAAVGGGQLHPAVIQQAQFERRRFGHGGGGRRIARG